MPASRTAIRQITEERRGDMPLFVHPEWQHEFDWLVQGTTARDAGSFASFGDQTGEVLQAQWRRLRRATAMRCAVLGRQVHGGNVLTHREFSNGWLVTDDADGHVTQARAMLLAVSVADCVPVFVVHAKNRMVAVLHAGWRGVAANILGACIAITGPRVRIHLGPAICGDCYEVGPEVHTALGLAAPERSMNVDLRSVMADQAAKLDVAARDITTSSWCTRCGDSPFFSHRAGHAGRQVGVIGIL